MTERKKVRRPAPVIAYQSKRATLYYGDCRDVELDEKAGLLCADPPYGIDYKSRSEHSKIIGDKSNEWVGPALKKCLRSLQIHRHFYIFGPDVVSDLTVCPTIQLVWDKGRMSAGGGTATTWSSGYEPITHGMYSPYKSHSNTGAGLVRLKRSTVISIPKKNNGRGAKVHPNEKPVALMRVLVEVSSNFDELVYDPFCGSGTTLVAAMIEGRRAVGVEKDAAHCKTAVKRLEEVDSWLDESP